MNSYFMIIDFLFTYFPIDESYNIDKQNLGFSSVNVKISRTCQYGRVKKKLRQKQSPNFALSPQNFFLVQAKNDIYLILEPP